MLSASERLTFKEVRALIKSRDPAKNISSPTLYRWCTFGVSGVTLQTENHGGIVVTSKRWIAEFFARIKEVRDAKKAAARQRATTRRRKAVAV